MNSIEPRDLAAERIEKLRDILRQKHIARVTQLRTELNVSPATIRRDMRHLERLGEIRRVHGGAISTASRLEEPLFDNKESLAAAEKQRIARAALKLIKPNDCVFLDGGSTVLALARLLRDQTGVTLVTNSLRVAMELATSGPRLMIVGGELRRLSQTFVGPLSGFTMEQIHLDVAFVGTIGMTPETGMTTTDPLEAYTKSLVMKRAQQVVVLADSTKVGRVAFARFGALDQVDVLITDKKIDPGAAKNFRRTGIKIVIA